MNTLDKSRSIGTLLLLALLVLGPLTGPICNPQATVRAQTQTDPIAEAFARIEKQIEKRRQELGVPGIGLALIKDDRVLVKGLGLKDVEGKLPVTPDTQFPIGSVTKSFTALSVLMSQEEGKLSIDDSPKRLLPYFRLRDPEADAKITIRDLLSHSSGLNRTDLAMVTGKLTRQELIRVAGEAKPTAKLREGFLYQNLMYAAAGEIVARAQKQPWEKFVPERIFKTLGMTNSTMTVPQMKKSKDHSLGYEYNIETKATRMLPYRPIDDVAPAGSINSSARDMVRWIRLMLGGGVIDGKRVISKQSFEEWTKPQQQIAGKNSYALGWFVMDWNGLKVLQHGGNIDGFTSLVGVVPEKNLGFVMLTNANGSQLPAEMMPVIFKEILGEPTAAVSPTPTGAEKEVGTYRLEAAKMDLVVRFEGGKLALVVPGQPVYELQNVGGRKYKLGGAPDGFFVTFSDDSLFLEQPQGNFRLPRMAEGSSKAEPVPVKPTLSADDIMARALEALGGEANWRKLTSRETLVEMDFEHQGVKGTGTILARAPYWYAADTTLTALGKPIGTTFEYLNAFSGGQQTSFSPADTYAGTRLNDLRRENSFFGPVDWRKGISSYDVKAVEKVGSDDAFVIEFKPESGTAFRIYFSTKSFLPVKRAGLIVSNTSSVQLPFTMLYEDYREVDGIRIPFKTIMTTPSLGDVVTYIKQVRHNVPLRNEAFQPKK